MSRPRLASAFGLLVVSSLSGCHRDSRNDPHHGRYLGIGTFSAGPLWAQLAAADQPKDRPTATVADDDQIIVVVDSNTGEVRECGDYTGYCISTNPWIRAIAPGQRIPVGLTKHAAELKREDQQAAATQPADRNAAAK